MFDLLVGNRQIKPVVHNLVQHPTVKLSFYPNVLEALEYVLSVPVTKGPLRQVCAAICQVEFISTTINEAHAARVVGRGELPSSNTPQQPADSETVQPAVAEAQQPAGVKPQQPPSSGTRLPAHNKKRHPTKRPNVSLGSSQTGGPVEHSNGLGSSES